MQQQDVGSQANSLQVYDVLLIQEQVTHMSA